MIKQSILVVLGFLLFLVGTANADRITIINSALNGGSYTWDLARADINSNFVELYTQHDLITVTGPVDLDTLDALSHVAVTLGTGNGLSLSTQALSLDLATNVANGAMASSWVVFLESIDTEAEFKALYNLEIGVDVQAFNAYLDMISGLTPAANALLGWDGTGTNIINITEIADSNIPSTITRDAELTAALSNLNGSNITSGTVGESYIDVLIARVSQLFDPDNPGEIGAVTPGKVNATELNVVAADGTRTIVLDENTTPITPGVGEAGFTNTAGTLQYYNDDGVLRDVGSGGGTLTITEQATDPLFSGMSTGDLIVSRASGDMFYKSATGGYQLTGTYTADPVIPVVSGVTIDGTTLVITYDINVTQGVGYNDNLLNIDGSTMGSDVAVTYASGDGTPAHTYTAATAAVNGETVTLDFLGGADALESSTGGDLAAFTGQAVVNNTAPTCATQTATPDITDTTGGERPIFTGAAGQIRGNAFTTPAANTDIESIEVYVADVEITGDLTIRIGTSSDLTTYLYEETLNVAIGDELKFHKVLVTGTPTLTPSTQYFFGCSWSGTSETEDFGITVTGTDVYPGNDHVFATNSWNLTSTASTYDLTFKVNYCD